jgi:hypothetical protein
MANQRGTLSEAGAAIVGSELRTLKTLFPNSPLAKHKAFDIVLMPPVPGRPRALIFRDLGGIANDWVATEFVLHYFEGAGPSPPVGLSVFLSCE